MMSVPPPSVMVSPPEPVTMLSVPVWALVTIVLWPLPPTMVSPLLVLVTEAVFVRSPRLMSSPVELVSVI